MYVLSMCFPQILYTSHEAIKRKLIDNQIPLGRDRERGSMYILHIPSQSIIYLSIYLSIYTYIYICIYVPLNIFWYSNIESN